MKDIVISSDCKVSSKVVADFSNTELRQKDLLNAWCFGLDMSRKPINSCVYMMKDEAEKVIKIGITKDLNARSRQIRSSSGRSLEIIFQSDQFDRAICHRIEKELKRRFESQRINGEFFSYQFIGIEVFLEKANLFCKYKDTFKK